MAQTDGSFKTLQLDWFQTHLFKYLLDLTSKSEFMVFLSKPTSLPCSDTVNGPGLPLMLLSYTWKFSFSLQVYMWVCMHVHVCVWMCVSAYVCASAHVYVGSVCRGLKVTLGVPNNWPPLCSSKVSSWTWFSPSLAYSGELACQETT